MAFAPPAPNAPPTHTSSSVSRSGTPPAARNIPPMAVTSSSDMMGGLVRAM